MRAHNPLRFNLSVSASPSSNVNNGTDTQHFGVPVPSSMRRLSGYTASVSASVQYRLAQGETWQTSATGQHYARRVFLSESSKAAAPTVDGSDFNIDVVQAGLRHARRVGERGAVLTLDANLGNLWYGGSTYHTFAGLTGSASYPLSKSTSVSLTLGTELRDVVQQSEHEVEQKIGLGLTHHLGSGDRISLQVDASANNAYTSSIDSKSATAKLRYTLGRPVAGIGISASASFGLKEYPNAFVGLGRNDTTISGDVQFTFNNASYAGFVPTMTLSAKKNESNRSVYNSEQYSISFGIRSAF